MKKLLLTMLCGLLCSLFSTAATTYQYEWEVAFAANKNGNVVAENNQFSANTKTINLGGATWTLSTNSTSFGKDGDTQPTSRGWQFGTGSVQPCPLTLSSTSFTGKTITAVKVNAAMASKADAKIEVTVGDTPFGTKELATAQTTYEFTGTGSGEIKIKYTQTTSGAVYLRALGVSYEDGGGDTPDPVTVTPPTITINGEKQGNDYLVGATVTISSETKKIQYTLDGTTPTAVNGEPYKDPFTLDTAKKYTIKAIAFDNTEENSSIVTTEEVNVVEKTVTPPTPSGDKGIVVFYSEGYTYNGEAETKIEFKGENKADGANIFKTTWTATDICDLNFVRNNNSSVSYTTGGVCRWYATDGIKITPKTGIKITGLKMVSGTSNAVCPNNTPNLNSINNTAWKAVSNTEATWTGSMTEAFTFTNTAQIRFQYLEVTYEKVPTGPEKPVITITGEKSGEDYLIGATASISAPNASYIFYTTDGSDPKAKENTAVTEVDGTSVDLGKLALGETTIKAYIWDADAVESAVASQTVNVVKKPAGISWSSDQCKVYLGEEPYYFPTLNNPNELKISYSIPAADAAIATIDKATGEITIVGKGSTTVRATYTSTDDSEFAGSWVQYTLTVAERPAGESVHATSYMFDFTAEEDFNHKGSYGMTFFAQTYSGSDYETDMENPVTKIIRKGVTLDFIVPEGIAVTYRLYQGTEKKQGESLRVYNAKLQFSVPAPGRINSIIFHKSGDNKWTLTEVSAGEMPTKWEDDDTATWTAPENESISSVWFNFNGDKHTRFSGITVYYDLQKPATPYVVSETADAIVVECDDWCELQYTKKPESASKAPSRAQLNDGTIEDTDEWYNHGSYQITIDKNNTVHQERGYSFIAYHAETDLKSDALNLYVGSDGTLTGVEGISAEADADAPIEFYDLQGRMVANPQGGIFIRRQGSKVTKVAL